MSKAYLTFVEEVKLERNGTLTIKVKAQDKEKQIIAKAIYVGQELLISPADTADPSE